MIVTLFPHMTASFDVLRKSCNASAPTMFIMPGWHALQAADVQPSTVISSTHTGHGDPAGRHQGARVAAGLSTAHESDHRAGGPLPGVIGNPPHSLYSVSALLITVHYAIAHGIAFHATISPASSKHVDKRLLNVKCADTGGASGGGLCPGGHPLRGPHR